VSGPGGASVWFRWQEVGELIQQFSTLATDLNNAAAPDVVDLAEEAKTIIYNGYPLGKTGGLRAGLKVKVFREQHRVRAQVLNTAPHSHLYEHGTEVRHADIGNVGPNRGKMPANPIFTQTMMRQRRRLHAGLPLTLETFGLKAVGGA